jgi:hypothetical protein
MFLFFSTDHPWLSALSIGLFASPFLGSAAADLLSTLTRKWRTAPPLYRASGVLVIVTIVLLGIQRWTRFTNWRRQVFRHFFRGNWRAGFDNHAAQPASRSTRLDAVLTTIRKLPMCEFEKRSNLLQKSVGELKQLLKERGVGADARNKCLQKSELGIGACRFVQWEALALIYDITRFCLQWRCSFRAVVALQMINVASA